MHPYSDPVGTKRLADEGALDPYRSAVHAEYVRLAREPGSAFTLLEAFETLARGKKSRVDVVNWIAFPRTAGATHAEIDRDRTTWQDEYVEWRVERSAARKVTRITFTTEFLAYYLALASVGLAALQRAIKDVHPGAKPTAAELFGTGFKPEAATPSARARRFAEHAESNPWVDGRKGILCLLHPSSTLSALFGLVGACAVPDAAHAPNDICALVGGACVPGRNSDPTVCAAVQGLARTPRGLSLADPVGVTIQRLSGVWKLGGEQIDINDPVDNKGAWSVTRNGRRAVLTVRAGLTFGDDPIVSGAQVATALTVGAAAISAPENALPAWARAGQESSRRIN